MPYHVISKYLVERGELPRRLLKYMVVKPLAVSVPSMTAIDVKDNEQVSTSALSWKEDNTASSLIIPIGVDSYSIQCTWQKTKNNNGSMHKDGGIYLYCSPSIMPPE